MKNAGKALEFAKTKHEGQSYGDEPYINHVIRVFNRITDAEISDDNSVNCGVVALLHDTLEDTRTSEVELAELFGLDVQLSVSILTRKKNQDYFSYIRSIRDSKDDVAIVVKTADLQENLSELKEKNAITRRCLF